MKRLHCLSFIVCLMVLGACGPKPEEQVKEFAVRFADFVNTNQKDSVQKYYPEFELTDSLVNVPVGNITITPEDVESEYFIEYTPTIGMSVNLNKNGEFTISDSKGIFTFPANKIELAKKTGMWDNSLSDLELAERMNDEDYFYYIQSYIKKQISNILTVGDWIRDDTGFPIGRKLKNNTDQLIKGSDYTLTLVHQYALWDYEVDHPVGHEDISTEKGQDIPPHSSVPFYCFGLVQNGDAAGTGPELKRVNFLIPEEELIDRFVKFTGHEYQDYIQGKGVSPRRKKSASKESKPSPSRRVGNDALSYILGSPSVDKNGELIHFFRGYFTDGKKQYPIMIAFIEKNGKISSAQYKNINYTALVKMNVKFGSRSLTLEGESRKKDFSIYLTSDNEGKSWTGTAISNSTLDVFLEPTSEQFKF